MVQFNYYNSTIYVPTATSYFKILHTRSEGKEISQEHPGRESLGRLVLSFLDITWALVKNLLHEPQAAQAKFVWCFKWLWRLIRLCMGKYLFLKKRSKNCFTKDRNKVFLPWMYVFLFLVNAFIAAGDI